MTLRTDTHRPSAIEPADYEYVAQEYVKADFDVLGAAMFMLEERKRINAHMDDTGGTYSRHEHGGNCHICGSVNAIYTVLFYHGPTNTYIRTGQDCAEKLDGSYNGDSFRRNCRDALAARAGKAKAEAYLAQAGVYAAWAIYLLDYEDLPRTDGGQVFWEEDTLRDIVGKLVRYGAISDKQEAFVRKLLDGIDGRAELEAKREAEKDAAKPIPAEYSDQRVSIEGTILSLKEVDNGYSTIQKMLIRHDDGWKLWGTVADALYDGEGELKGKRVSFDAKIQISDDDPKFGFFSRPTKARIVA